MYEAARVFDWLIDPARHFLLSACLGLLVYLLTSTTLFAQLSITSHLRQRKVNMAAVYITIGLSLFFGVVFAWGLHWVLDYGWSLYSAPLDPPMNLRVP